MSVGLSSEQRVCVRAFGVCEARGLVSGVDGVCVCGRGGRNWCVGLRPGLGHGGSVYRASRRAEGRGFQYRREHRDIRVIVMVTGSQVWRYSGCGFEWLEVMMVAIFEWRSTRRVLCGTGFISFVLSGTGECR